MRRTIRVTRKDLYDRVWSTPISRVAKEYGISDVGLSKICRRHRIPTPGLGYWAKIAHGQVIPRPPLPVNSDPQGEFIEFVLKEDVAQSIPAEQDEFCHRELARIRQIDFPAPKSDVKLIKHPLLIDLRKAKPERFRPWEGWIKTGRHRFPWINIPKGSLDRALLLLDSLLVASELCGYSIRTEPDGSEHIQVFEALIRISVRERARQVEAVQTQRPPGTFKPIGESTFNYVSLGRMSITITDARFGLLERTWSDSKSERLEGLLPQILEGMTELAARKQTMLKQERDAEILRFESQRRRWEEERKAQLETERLSELLSEVDDWSKARRLREYLAARKKGEIERSGEPGPSEEFKTWLDWAEKEADRMDPLPKG